MMIDDPVRAALEGAHARLAQRVGGAVRYQPDVAPFAAQPRDDAEADDLARLVGPGGTAVLRALHLEVPPGWELTWQLPGVQMLLDGPGKEDPDAVVLGPHDVPEMLDLVERTQPGPFHERTVAMGRYLGIRERGDAPFLHASAANTNAIRLYEQLGFRLCAQPRFATVRAPGESRAVPTALGEA